MFYSATMNPSDNLSLQDSLLSSSPVAMWPGKLALPISWAPCLGEASEIPTWKLIITAHTYLQQSCLVLPHHVWNRHAPQKYYKTSRVLGDDSDWKQHNDPHISGSLHLRLPRGFLLVPVLHPPQVVPNGLASAAPPNAAKCVGLTGVNIQKSQVRGRA